MSELHFVNDGRARALKGLETRLEEIRLKIETDIQTQYAPLLAGAGFFKRKVLRVQMKRESRRRLALAYSEIKVKAPPDALYVTKFHSLRPGR
jgi:hypothetical protein